MGWKGVATGTAVLGLLVLFTVAAIAPGIAIAAGAVTFDQTPAAQSNQTTTSFVYHATGGSGTFTCSLDGGSFVTCPSPHAVSGLSEGTHTFTVQLITTAGTQPAPDSYTWKVDLTPPLTQVTGKPPALTNSTTATFTFTSPDPTATFRCSLNGAAAAPCVSPVVYSGLTDGTRSLLIQAVDPAGNIDPQAGLIVWTVDAVPPDTVLAHPGDLTGQDVAVFTFTSSEANSTFQCSFRNAPFTACASPIAEDVPGSGAEVFKVRAVDGAGNIDPTPAVDQWTSDLTPPKRPHVTIFAAPTVHAGAVATSARATTVSPRPVAKKAPPLTLRFTNPLSQLLTTPVFTLSTRLHAQWSTDTTAKRFDVTLDLVPQDSTGMGFHGEDLDLHEEYRNTKRTALNVTLYPGTTMCVKVDATDAVGNTSKPTISCITVPVSFTPRDIGPPPTRDAKAFRGYYMILGSKGYEFVQEIDDGFFFTPRHASLVAERCPTCGQVEFDFDRFVGNPKNKLHEVASVNLTSSDHSGDFHLIDVPLPVRRLQRDGTGDLVIRAVAGKPRIAGIGLSG